MQREAWQEGALEGFSPVLMPAAHALVQARRDIERACENLTLEELWHQPNGAPSVGFHLRHTAGSINRLLTYARGESLSEEQYAALKSEGEINHSIDAVSALVKLTVNETEAALRAIKTTLPETIFEPRYVGRERLPTNVFGLLFHIAEHTMRHTGQIVTTARIVRAVNFKNAGLKDATID